MTSNNVEIKAKYVLSNATLRCTLLDLIPDISLDEKTRQAVKSIDYTSPVTKINGELSIIVTSLTM